MKVGICGAGTMGRGIALACVQAQMECILYDLNAEVLDAGRQFVEKQLNSAVSKGKMTAENAQNAQKLFHFSSSIEDLRSCELVVEAIVEQKVIKDTLFKELEATLSDTAIIGSNTSSISIASLACGFRRPDRFIGLHFFNPAHIMKLVEVICGPRTSEETLQKTLGFVKSLSKSPAVAKDVPGFIVNRVARNYYNEAQRIVMESAAEIAQVDTIMKAHGFKMGPFELMDLIGVDVNLDVTKSMYQQYFFEPRFQPSLLQQQYVDAGLHGRKTGRGFYDYSEQK